MAVRLANVVSLGVKELRSLRADPVLLFLVFYLFTFAIYTVTTGVKFEVSHAAIAVVDEDQSTLSRRIAAASLEPYFLPAESIAPDRIDRDMGSDKYVFVLEIPPRFEADTLAGRKPEIQLDIDATAMSMAGNGAAYLVSIISQEVQGYLDGGGRALALPINLVVRTKFNPNQQSDWFVAVMQLINNVTMMAVILTGAALIREREHGTIEHLLVMPVTPMEIMLAKIWANGMAIVVAAVLSLLLVVQGILQVPLAGSLPLFIFGTALYLVSVTALGLLVATFTDSMGQFGLLVLPILIILNLLSGSTTPMESMPGWLQLIMQISPCTHFVSFSQAVLYRGAGWDAVWPQLAGVTVTGMLFFVMSMQRFRAAMLQTG